MARHREKTNAMRTLEAKGVAYTAHYYSPEIHSAQGAADAVGLSAGQVFKTLVAVRPDGEPLLALVSGDRELDLKKLARAAGEKRLRMASRREAEELTGLLVGGISALALLRKGLPVFVDALASRHARILVNAGRRGINVALGVEDLVAVTRAHVCSISRPLDPSGA